MRPATAVHPPDTGDCRVTSLAVIADMRLREIGFTVDNYAVWRCYMTGAVPALKRAIDIVLSNGLAIDDRILAVLYARHFNDARDARSLGEAIRHGLALFDDITVVLDTVAHEPAVAAVRAQLGQALTEMNGMAEAFIRHYAEAEERIAQLEHSLDDARREASTDQLTKVFNRRGFDAEMRALAGDAMNDGSDLAFVLIDIDHFKQVNDRWGHPVGDSVLQMLATILKRSVRATDRLARYGGEEFAVILPGCCASAALTIAETLRAAVVAQPIEIPASSFLAGGQLTVTISAGVSCYDHGESLALWLGRADAALYQAKQGGRNRVVFGDACRETREAEPSQSCTIVPLTLHAGV